MSTSSSAPVDAAGGVPLMALTLAVGAIFTLIFLIVHVFGKQFQPASAKTDATAENAGQNGHVTSGDDDVAPKEKKTQPAKKQVQRKEKPKQDTFSHPLLVTSLKGQGGEILSMDLSPNGKYLATSSDDRTVFLWQTKQFESKDVRSVRANVELDHGTHVKFSPDSKAFVVSLSYDNTVRIFRLGRKDDGSIGNVVANTDHDFKNNVPEGKGDIIGVDVASTGKFILTVHSDVHLLLWDLKGRILSTINTNQMINKHGAVSPCGRYVASCGFTPDVKIWEVQFSKTGDFVGVQRAFELKGHSAGVLHFSFSSDSTKMASVSKDGTWKLWNIGVEWQKGQDPKCVQTGKVKLSADPSNTKCALSPNGKSLAVSTMTDLTMFQSLSGEEDRVIKDVHSSFSGLLIDSSNRFILTCGDKVARVFHNVAGYKGTINENKEKIVNNRAGKLVEERLRKEVEEAERSLASIL